MITIENCKFAYKCPKTWHELTKIEGRLTVRHCGACDRQVHYCAIDGELMDRVRAGDCVAIMRTVDVDFPEARPRRLNSPLEPREPLWLGVILRDYPTGGSLQWE